MKKIIMSVVLLAGLVLVLSACGKVYEDKLQGKWKADNEFAMESIGDSMTIDKHSIKVNRGAKETPVKYFNFKDKDDKNT